MRNIGYTRVSTSTQDAQLQLDTLVAAEVQKRDIFADAHPGADSCSYSREVISPLMRIMKVWSSVRMLTKPESMLRT